MKTEISQNESHIRIELIDNNIRASVAEGRMETLYLNGAPLPALAICGIHTAPEYRRKGLVRQSMDRLFEYADAHQLPISLLHPFSDSYYRKFGYERIADHRILSCPMGALEGFERCSDFVCLKDRRRAEELAAVFNTFAAARNAMFQRAADCGHFFAKGRKCYLHCDESGKADAYLSLSIEKHFFVNNMVDTCLHIHEFAFTTPDALKAILGFIRMFEGETERISFENIAMAPEIEQVFCRYTEAEIRIVPDLMARIHQPAAVLKAMQYPQRAGKFTLCMEDEILEVRYAEGNAEVRSLPADAEWDLRCDRPALARLLFANDTFSPAEAAYLPGVTLRGSCEDFFAAFPHRPCGLFEHF